MKRQLISDRGSDPTHSRQSSANIDTTLDLRPKNLQSQATSGHQRELPTFTEECWTVPDQITVNQSVETEHDTSPFASETILTAAGLNSSHIISPAVADDNDALESYLSSLQRSHGSFIIRPSTSSNPPGHFTKPVLFNAVLRRPLGTIKEPNSAPQKCEIIEKFVAPNLQDVIDLFFAKVNICFSVLDQQSFQKLYLEDKDKTSPALLSNLYANALIYWNTLEALKLRPCPDTRFIWVQANEALHSELWLSPGTSTVVAIILNVLGRPSTSIFGNGGMIGTAVALSNALGLNRDPSGWNISPREKSFRIRIWWLVVIHDRWCSLAYGTPMQINRVQYDVPFPTVDDIATANITSSQKRITLVFLAFVSLTEVLGRLLEHMYHIAKDVPRPAASASDLELLLSNWEGNLTDEVRRVVLRGTNINTPGAPSLRMGYLAVKLLLKRIQLDVDKAERSLQEDIQSQYYFQAQRASEEIVHLMQDLTPDQLQDFWLPMHAFSLTSATTFLLKCALRSPSEPPNQTSSYRIARDMVDTLRHHRQQASWDLADNCIGNCADIIEKIGSTQDTSDLNLSNDLDFLDWMNLDLPVLDRFGPDYVYTPLPDG